jgi:hypothetical protein
LDTLPSAGQERLRLKTVKETITAASSAGPLEKTSEGYQRRRKKTPPAAAAGTGKAAAPDRPRSLWPLSLYDTETFFALVATIWRMLATSK